MLLMPRGKAKAKVVEEAAARGVPREVERAKAGGKRLRSTTCLGGARNANVTTRVATSFAGFVGTSNLLRRARITMIQMRYRRKRMWHYRRTKSLWRKTSGFARISKMGRRGWTLSKPTMHKVARSPPKTASMPKKRSR